LCRDSGKQVHGNPVGQRQWLGRAFNEEGLEMNDRVKRLAVAVGGVAVVAWLVFIAQVTNVYSEINADGWKIAIAVSIPCFLVPFALVQGIAWVIAGFRLLTRHQEDRSSKTFVGRTGAPHLTSDSG
jgi:hypothetical protein